jgi:hypothetical protein
VSNFTHYVAYQALRDTMSVRLDRPKEKTSFIGSTTLERYDPENAVWSVYSLSSNKGVSGRKDVPDEVVPFRVSPCSVLMKLGSIGRMPT